MCIKIAITFYPPWQKLLWLRISKHSAQLSLSLWNCPFGALLFCIYTKHCNILISSISAKAEPSRTFLIKLINVKNTCFKQNLCEHLSVLVIQVSSSFKKSQWDQKIQVSKASMPFNLVVGSQLDEWTILKVNIWS